MPSPFDTYTPKYPDFDDYCGECDRIAAQKFGACAVEIPLDAEEGVGCLKDSFSSDVPPDQAVHDLGMIRARELWKMFDTPVDQNERIQEPFLIFPTGTHREDVWQWFEVSFDCSVAEDLMKVA
jgi:hypothetical protein